MGSSYFANHARTRANGSVEKVDFEDSEPFVTRDHLANARPRTHRLCIVMFLNGPMAAHFPFLKAPHHSRVWFPIDIRRNRTLARGDRPFQCFRASMDRIMSAAFVSKTVAVTIQAIG